MDVDWLKFVVWERLNDVDWHGLAGGVDKPTVEEMVLLLTPTLKFSRAVFILERGDKMFEAISET